MPGIFGNKEKGKRTCKQEKDEADIERGLWICCDRYKAQYQSYM